jgi:hypothetical protein
MYALFGSTTLQIQSYTRIPNSGDSTDILVTCNTPTVLDQDSPAAFLDEKSCNYHEISASADSPAAFFDVLSPPYAELNDSNPDSRHCHFYRKVMVDSEKQILKLEMIDVPKYYFCDSIAFEKPEFMS